MSAAGRRPATAAALALAGLAAVVGLAGPAGAIESKTFGLEPTDRDGPRPNLREPLRPGRVTEDSVRVFNKTGQPLTLRLSVLPATVGRDGSVRLTGSEAAASWVELEEREVTLAPRASRVVGFEVHAPRELPRGAMTMAVVAEPVAPPSEQVAVLQRLAVMGYFEPARGSSLVATLGWIAWAAGGVLAMVVALALSPTRRGRRRVARLSTLRLGRRAAAPGGGLPVARGLARLHAGHDLAR